MLQYYNTTVLKVSNFLLYMSIYASIYFSMSDILVLQYVSEHVYNIDAKGLGVVHCFKSYRVYTSNTASQKVIIMPY